MSKKKKGSQTTRAQQQEAAARRRSVAVPAGRDRSAPPSPTPQPDGPGQPAPIKEIRHYLDVSAVRIQDWLTRTPDLKFRRGASVLLTEATARDAGNGELPPGMRWNDQAGELDGVISLEVDDDVADDDVEACLTAAAHAVARRMRTSLPYCPIQAVSGRGDSYAAAYEEMEQARRNGSYLADSPPVPPEVILAKPCDQCRSAAATQQAITIIAAEPPKDLCPDCHARFEAAGGTKGDHLRRSPRPERRMKDALQAAGMQVKGFPDNFKTMATAGQHDQDDAATELALIYADGNKVGAFLTEAAQYARRGASPAKADIVPALDHATVTALADAVISRFRGWSRPPVLANLAGGDDLLVSVPAIDAWLFPRTMGTPAGADDRPRERRPGRHRTPAPRGAGPAGHRYRPRVAGLPQVLTTGCGLRDEGAGTPMTVTHPVAIPAEDGQVPRVRSVSFIVFALRFTEPGGVTIPGRPDQRAHLLLDTDPQGRPQLPGTSLAGALREMIRDERGEDAADMLFGRLLPAGRGGTEVDAQASQLWVLGSRPATAAASELPQAQRGRRK